MSPINPTPVDRGDLTAAMTEVLGLIVEIYPAIVWMVREVPPQQWPSGWTRIVAQMGELLGASWPATILSQHAEWLARTMEVERGWGSDIAICGLCPVEGPPLR